MYTPFVRVSAVSCTGPDKHYTKRWIYVSQNGKETALCRIRETDGERCAGASKRQILINKISQNQTTKRTLRRETILLVYGGACAHSTKAAVRQYTSIRWHHNTKDHFLQYKHARWRDIIVPRPDNIIPYSAQLTYKMNYNLYPVHTLHGAAKSIPQRFIWLHISPNNRNCFICTALLMKFPTRIWFWTLQQAVKFHKTLCRQTADFRCALYTCDQRTENRDICQTFCYEMWLGCSRAWRA